MRSRRVGSAFARVARSVLADMFIGVFSFF